MPDELICGFCSQNLEPSTISQRQDHYEAHFLASAPSTEASAPQHSTKKDKKRFHPIPREPWKKLVKKIENDTFWYPSLGTSPPSNFAPGLIPLVKQSLTSFCTKGKLTRAVLCHEKVVHIGKELWDAGWGCGYRNFLMLCTGLLEQQIQPLYLPLLGSSPSPCVRSLQLWIQRAWEDGFDQIGRTELRNKIIGTNKWIGTAEIYIALTHRGIPAELIDFGDFQDKRDCATAVIQWVVDYFTPQAPEPNTVPSTSINDVLGRTTVVFTTELMPVILQHKGHSRIIIGYQRHTDGTVSLLTFDTGRLLPHALRTLARLSYSPVIQNDSPQGHSEPTESQVQPPKQQYNGFGRPMPPMDLFKTSERTLGENIVNTDKPGDSTNNTFMSKLKGNNQHRIGNKVPSLNSAKSGRQAEPDLQQVQKVFRLTHQQLSSHAEYQVLYVPLRPPLTEEEKLNRKVVKCSRITGQSPPLTNIS